jgi:hypothetical protein
MTIEFSTRWVLTDESNGGSNFDIPILLNFETGKAYKADDIILADPSLGSVPAVRVVDHFLSGMKKELTKEEMALIRKFFVG